MTNVALLKEAVAKSGLKKAYIADKLGLSYQGYLNKENGKYQFTEKEIALLRKLLNLSDRQTILIFLTIG